MIGRRFLRVGVCDSSPVEASGMAVWSCQTAFLGVSLTLLHNGPNAHFVRNRLCPRLLSKWNAKSIEVPARRRLAGLDQDRKKCSRRDETGLGDAESLGNQEGRPSRPCPADRASQPSPGARLLAVTEPARSTPTPRVTR